MIYYFCRLKASVNLLDFCKNYRDNDFLETVSNASYHSCEREQSVNSFDGQEINRHLEVGRLVSYIYNSHNLNKKQ